MSYQHLKDRSYYEEMYDRHTVERCRWHEEPRPLSKEETDARKGLTSGQIQWARDLASDWLLFQLVGDRWLQREKSIDEWMERDKQRDAMLERAQKPLIRCSTELPSFLYLPYTRHCIAQGIPGSYR